MLRVGVYTIMFLFSTLVWAENFSRPWGSYTQSTQGADSRNSGYKGKYNPWESILKEDEEPDPFEKRHRNNFRQFGQEKPEIEWPSEERMGRAGKEDKSKVGEKQRKYPQPAIPNNNYNPYGGGYGGGNNNYYPGRFPGW